MTNNSGKGYRLTAPQMTFNRKFLKLTLGQLAECTGIPLAKISRLQQGKDCFKALPDKQRTALREALKMHQEERYLPSEHREAMESKAHLVPDQYREKHGVTDQLSLSLNQSMRIGNRIANDPQVSDGISQLVTTIMAALSPVILAEMGRHLRGEKRA